MTFDFRQFKCSSRIYSAIIATIFAVIITAVPAANLIYKNNKNGVINPAYPNTRFAVISDLHFYDASLGTDGAAFNSCLNSDHKLLKESERLLDNAIFEIERSGVKFVLVPGDLTKDGELSSHLKLAKKLKRLKDKGVSVYVITGNHDINNPQACSYNGTYTSHVESVTTSQFESIYSDFGYGNAVIRDKNSLSYVAEPQKGIWLVAVDSCRYAENPKDGEEIVSGRITSEEEKWIAGVLQSANEKGKTVFVMIHHGIIEHWKGQADAQPDFLLKNYKKIAELLAANGVRIVFTGHFHAQDISCENYNGSGSLYDIETGSLVSVPCPLRICNISDGTLFIKTIKIIDNFSPDFKMNACLFENKVVEEKLYRSLRRVLVNQSDAHYIAGYYGKAYTAHFMGDERLSDKPELNKKRLTLWSRIVFRFYDASSAGLWEDKYPPDNDCYIILKK